MIVHRRTREECGVAARAPHSGDPPAPGAAGRLQNYVTTRVADVRQNIQKKSL
jgi:hypothetical protein